MNRYLKILIVAALSTLMSACVLENEPYDHHRHHHWHQNEPYAYHPHNQFFQHNRNEHRSTQHSHQHWKGQHI